MKLYLVKSPESDDLPPHKGGSRDTSPINLRSVVKGALFWEQLCEGCVGWGVSKPWQTQKWALKRLKHLAATMKTSCQKREGLSNRTYNTRPGAEASGRWIDSWWLVKSIDTSFQNASVASNIWRSGFVKSLRSLFFAEVEDQKGVYNFVCFRQGVNSPFCRGFGPLFYPFLRKSWTLKEQILRLVTSLNWLFTSYSVINYPIKKLNLIIIPNSEFEIHKITAQY